MQGGRYPHIIRAVLGQPWAIDPNSLAWAAILDVLTLRSAGERLSDDEIAARIEAAGNGPRRGGSQQGSVAVIPLYGIISPRVNLMSQMSGGTTAEEFGATFAAAVADPNIAAIVLDVDSTGGDVQGIDEVASQIRAARGTKPIAAVANHTAASAAYWIASQADELVSTPSGEVGSIGIIAAHDDLTEALAQEGIKRTVITAGKYKGEGALGQSLSAEATANIQGQADAFYAMFTASVAKGRGVSADAVRSGYGEGRVVMAKEALAMGMIDRIDSLDNTVRRMANGNGRASMIRRPLAAMADFGAATEPEYRRALVAEAVGGLYAGPVPIHHGTTDDGPWDGPATKSAIPNDAGEKVFLRMYAWYDDNGADPNGDGFPDAKSDYRFIHHFYRGGPGPASTVACSAGIAVLNGARTGTTIPDGDRAGVHAHLAAHLRDAGQDVPPLALSPSETPTASASIPDWRPKARVALALRQAELGIDIQGDPA
jgi:signal peptide peptidase SppA